VSRHRQCRTALLRVRSGETFRTFFAEFGSCGLVTSNTGYAAKVGASLSADVARLAVPVPSTTGGVAGGCMSTGNVEPPAGTAGAATRQDVLAAFLARRPVGYPPSPASWVEVDAGIFVAANGQIAVAPVSGGGQGYYLAYETNC
jgi:hypothetical protein